MRPKRFKREDVIEKAMQVFWRKGYHATSSDDLFEATGIGEGSFYREFKKGKREVFELALQYFNQQIFENFKAAVEASEHPLEVVRSFFKTMILVDDAAHFSGCMICNTLVEMIFLDEQMFNVAAGILKKTESIFRHAIEHAKNRRQMTNPNSSS